MLEITVWWGIYIYYYVKSQFNIFGKCNYCVDSVELNAIEPGFVIIKTSLVN